jgi:hypothetical protein
VLNYELPTRPTANHLPIYCIVNENWLLAGGSRPELAPLHDVNVSVNVPVIVEPERAPLPVPPTLQPGNPATLPAVTTYESDN